jgi:hypothetical protein
MIALAVPFAGCTAILGDFKVATTGGGGDGGAADGPVVTEGGGGEGGDAPAGLPFLTCDTFQFPQPRVIVKLDTQPIGERTLMQPFIARVDRDRVRVVTQQDIQSAAPKPAQVHTFEPDRPTSPIITLPLPGDRVQGVLRLTRSIVVLSNDSSSPPALQAQAIPDALVGNVLPPPDKLSTASLSNSYFRGTAVPLGDQAIGYDYFYAAAFNASPTPPDNFVLNVGRARNAPGGPELLASSATRANARNANVLLPFGAHVYMFTELDGASGGSSDIYKVPADAVFSTTPTPRSIAPSGSTNTFLMVAGGPTKTDTFALAAVEIVASGTPLGQMRVGPVAGTKLDTFFATDLPAVHTFKDTSEIPFDNGRSLWVGEDLLMIGSGIPAKGLNFLWFDASGVLRGKRTGAEALLQDRTGIGRVAATREPFSVTPRLANFDVVWSERTGDQATGYDTLYYNKLNCH